MSSWADAVRGRGVAEVAEALGLAVDRRRRAVSPCPACRAERRHPKRRDRRGAVGFTPDGMGFRCFECDAHGDAVTLVAWKVAGTATPTRWGEIRAECVRLGLCADDAEKALRRAVRRTPTPPPPPPPPARPPGALELWERCGPVTRSEAVSAWLRGRALDPAEVELRDLARALPLRGALPAWCSFRSGRRWPDAGYRVVVAMHGPEGLIESIHARTVTPGQEPKAATPTGYEVRGLVMADALGRELLAGNRPPTWDNRVVIAEGVPDFLTWAIHIKAAASTPAVLGVISGSWSEALAQRIPQGCTAIVRVHHDEAGDKYAETIRATLAGRCTVKRSRLSDG